MSPQVEYRAAPIDQLPAGLKDRWRALERFASEPNAFLSSRFLEPAWRLQGGSPPLIVWGESPGGELAALGAFEVVPGSRRLPCEHLRSWRCRHTFTDGFLVDRRQFEPALRGFWEFIIDQQWAAVEFEEAPLESDLFARLDQTAAEAGVLVAGGATWQRPVCLPHLAGKLRGTDQMSTRRAKSLRSGWRFLERYGDASFSVRRTVVTAAASSRMLMLLEALGWKGAAGTALSATSAEQQFCHELVSNFAANDDAVFLDLDLSGRTIASLLVLRSGRGGFAFKLGWDPQFERAAPGYQLLSELQAAQLADFADLETIDSCASPGTFIESVWPTRRTFGARVYGLSRAARALLTLRDGVRRARSLWSF